MSVAAPPIIVCKTWGAAPGKARPTVVGRPDKIIIHHTDGHSTPSPSVNSPLTSSASAYARMLQSDMQNRRGWDDSGHNFLVMRSGLILQGRWGTVAAIERGRMVMSAHCIGQNQNPGIEHEHVVGESLTPEQGLSTVWLMAWICDRTGISPTALYGHDVFYPTACPSNLGSMILQLRMQVAAKINADGRGKRARSTKTVTRLSVRRSLAS